MARGGGDDGGDDAGRYSAEDIVSVDLAPLIATRRLSEVVPTPVFDAFAAIPVLLAHVVALLPLVVADVLLIMIVVAGVLLVVIVVMLGERRERGAADAEKDR
jgi:hypothetical protein